SFTSMRLTGANTTRSPIRIVPACGRSRPAMARRSAVLPLPAGPNSAVTVPLGTVSEMALRMSRLRCRNPSPVIASSAMVTWDKRDQSDCGRSDAAYRCYFRAVARRGSTGLSAQFAGSAGKSAALEESLLLRRGGAAEHRIAMGEAAEAADDVG